MTFYRLLLALLLSLGSTVGLVDLTEIGNGADPNGIQADVGNQADPNGSEVDKGNQADPDGLEADKGNQADPNG
jgi:hypothetical protein